MRHLALPLAAAALLAAAPALAQQAPPNAPDQEPAFEGQTRAPLTEQRADVKAELVARDLPNLWGLAFLPDGRMLVTAKRGDMLIVGPDGEAGAPLAGVPAVDDDGQGGLLDVMPAPDFAESALVYFAYAEPRDGGNGTTVARARLVTDEAGSGALENLEVIFRQTPTYDGGMHFGSRLVFAPDGKLFITLGERSDRPIRDQAQDLGSGLGKIFRLNPDGSVPEDNPFVGEAGALPGIWSYGHRNLQSATLDGEGRLWTVEHGPKGGDELNRPEPGLNYGWPVITYGVAYSGAEVGEGITRKEGMEQPVYYWDPVIAPSGMAYYDGEAIPEWQGAFVVGGLVSQGLVVLHMEGDRVAREERLPLGARIRDVALGPDGALYAVTETRGGGGSTILRVTAD
ncbi:MAG: PQQ-dependent sugar dehydrogenase [Tistlia sp.]|uniref:PQQ-dependent sugar dehydrogenase n=1 Tax=Tistlia sp. TaxID=3057121 RepID=UPI0034A51D65